MCGRYVSPEEAALNREYQIDRRNSHLRLNEELEAALEQSFNVAPTQQVPVVRVIREQAGEREAVRMRWGLIPYWANGKPTSYSTINCRIESMHTSASFRDAWRRGQRCILPCVGFYEWHVNADGSKQPYYIRPVEDDATFPIAGLWDQTFVGAREAMLSCTIITMPANELLAGIHNDKQRMPAILRRQAIDVWLTDDAEAARAVLQPYPSSEMLAWPVSKRVNSARNTGRDLIEPVQVEYREEIGVATENTKKS